VKWTKETFRIHELPVGSVPALHEAINYYHVDDQPELTIAINRALDDAESFDLELRLITAKGNLRYIRVICQPITESGRVAKLRGTF